MVARFSRWLRCEKRDRRVRAGGRPRPTVVEQEKTPIVRRRNDIAIEKILTTAPSLRVVPERPLRGTDPTTTAHCPLHHPLIHLPNPKRFAPCAGPAPSVPLRRGASRSARSDVHSKNHFDCTIAAGRSRTTPTGTDGAGSAYRPSPPPFTRPMNRKMLLDPAPIRSPVADYVLTNPPRSFPL